MCTVLADNPSCLHTQVASRWQCTHQPMAFVFHSTANCNCQFLSQTVIPGIQKHSRYVCVCVYVSQVAYTFAEWLCGFGIFYTWDSVTCDPSFIPSSLTWILLICPRATTKPSVCCPGGMDSVQPILLLTRGGSHQLWVLHEWSLPRFGNSL